MALSSLANALGSVLDRPIVNRTGLSGRFDTELDYAAPGTTADLLDNPQRVWLFIALQEQVGLRLQAEDVPLEVLVIGRLERPGPD